MKNTPIMTIEDPEQLTEAEQWVLTQYLAKEFLEERLGVAATDQHVRQFATLIRDFEKTNGV